jgi:hypothetical protein
MTQIVFGSATTIDENWQGDKDTRTDCQGDAQNCEVAQNSIMWFISHNLLKVLEIAQKEET